MIAPLVEASLSIFIIDEPIVGFNGDYIRSLQITVRSWFISFLRNTSFPVLIFDACNGKMRHNMARGDGLSMISKELYETKTEIMFESGLAVGPSAAILGPGADARA